MEELCSVTEVILEVTCRLRSAVSGRGTVAGCALDRGEKDGKGGGGRASQNDVMLKRRCPRVDEERRVRYQAVIALT